MILLSYQRHARYLSHHFIPHTFLYDSTTCLPNYYAGTMAVIPLNLSRVFTGPRHANDPVCTYGTNHTTPLLEASWYSVEGRKSQQSLPLPVLVFVWDERERFSDFQCAPRHRMVNIVTVYELCVYVCVCVCVCDGPIKT